jgi:hypothetical protein
LRFFFAAFPWFDSKAPKDSYFIFLSKTKGKLEDL